MPSRQPIVAAAVLGLVAASLSAQTISDGNMRYTTRAMSATSETPLAFDLRGDALSIDHGFEHWWHFRINGDPREYALKNIGGTVEGVRNGGTHFDRDFQDVDGRGLLAARIDIDIYDAGPASGAVINRLTLHNRSANPVSVDLFNYIDLDVANSAGNDVCTGTGSSHRVTDVSGVSIEVRAFGNDRSQVGAYPTVRNLLTNAVVDDLSNALPPFSGDYTGAFQWSNRTLAPGEWRTFTVLVAIDTTAQIPPITESYGVGVDNNREIYTDGVALQDNSQLRFIDVRLKGAPPSTPVGLLSNSNVALGVPFLGVVVWVDPLPPAQFPIGLTDGNGEAFYSFPIPMSPYLAGFPVWHQFFYEDFTSPSGVAGYTGGLVTYVGKL